MHFSATYVHTNLVAKDWKKLADFYQIVFGCIPVPPQRDLGGEAISNATAIMGAHILGMHMRLPGWGENGPTLEIFSYTPELEHAPVAVNRPGFGHIAFLVDNVQNAIDAVLENGGCMVGKLVSVAVADHTVTFAYLTDPEGNVIEVQSWG